MAKQITPLGDTPTSITTENVTAFPAKEAEPKKEIFIGPGEVLVKQVSDGEMFAVHETLYETVYKKDENFELIKKK
jgi:hypothetical protein